MTASEGQMTRRERSRRGAVSWALPLLLLLAQATALDAQDDGLPFEDVRRPVFRGNLRYNFTISDSYYKSLSQKGLAKGKYISGIFLGDGGSVENGNSSVIATKTYVEGELRRGRMLEDEGSWSLVGLVTDTKETELVEKFVENSLQDLAKKDESLDKLIVSHTGSSHKHIQMYPEGSPPDWSAGEVKPNVILVEDVHPSKLPKPALAPVPLFHKPGQFGGSAPFKGPTSSSPHYYETNAWPPPDFYKPVEKPYEVTENNDSHFTTFHKPSYHKPVHHYEITIKPPKPGLNYEITTKPPVSKPSHYYEPSTKPPNHYEITTRPPVSKPSHYYEPSTKPPNHYEITTRPPVSKPLHYYEPSTKPPNHYEITTGPPVSKPSHYYEPSIKPPNHYEITTRPPVSKPSHYYEPSTKPPNHYEITTRPPVSKPSHYYEPSTKPPNHYEITTRPPVSKPSHYYEPSTKPPNHYEITTRPPVSKPSHYYEPSPRPPPHYYEPVTMITTKPPLPPVQFDYPKPILAKPVFLYPRPTETTTSKPQKPIRPTYSFPKPVTVRPAFENEPDPWPEPEPEPAFRPVSATITSTLPSPVVVEPTYSKPPPEPPPSRPPAPAIVVIESPVESHVDCGAVQVVNNANFKECPDVTVVLNAANAVSSPAEGPHAALAPVASPGPGLNGAVPLPAPVPPAPVVPVVQEDDDDDDYDEEDDEPAHPGSTAATPVKPDRPSRPTFLGYILSALPGLFGPLSISLWIVLFGPLSFIVIGMMGVASFLFPWIAPSLLFSRIG